MPALDEALFIPDQIPDLDYVGRYPVVEDLDSLRGGHGAGEELDQIAGFEDSGGIISFTGSAHGHAAFDEIERAGDVMSREGAGNEGPCGF